MTRARTHRARSAKRRAAGRVVLSFVALLSAVSGRPAIADGGVVYFDIATLAETGLAYSRADSERRAIWDELTQRSDLLFTDLQSFPNKPAGAPGLAIFDFDNDGDLDLFATNGPAAANSLFANQLAESGRAVFVDIAEPAGLAAPEQDASGVCFGDTDNDGDSDLLVLDSVGQNRFYENNGDGTFTDLSGPSGLAADIRSSTSCSFGDVDNDGLLDVVVANCCETMDDQRVYFEGGLDLTQFNQLFRNTGGNVFVDASADSGILDLRFADDSFDGSPTLTWSVALVDYDGDGDGDLFQADHQGNFPLASEGGLDRGTLRLLQNDGDGQFTDISTGAAIAAPGQWHGLAFGDLDGNGHLDVYATNAGDWLTTVSSPLDPVYGDFFDYQLGRWASRWFLGGPDGVFTDPGVGDSIALPLGWGTAMLDYDNDGDTDLLSHGGFDTGIYVELAPAMLLTNDGSATFVADQVALADSIDHGRRLVQGVATGDLDDDGFVDIATVSSLDAPDDLELTTFATTWGSPYDGGRYHQTFTPTGSPVLEYSGVRYDRGSLSVELSSGDNGNRWAKVRLLGTRGLISGGTVNRDAIGAVVSFETPRRKKAMWPIVSGASYASQSSLEIVLGLGDERRGMVEILWPGGVRNRLYGLKLRERLVLPEIPCSYDGDWGNLFEYAGCVSTAIFELFDADIVDEELAGRLFASALRAYTDSNF